MKLRFALLAAFAVAPCIVHSAQEPPAELDPVVVTATRTPVAQSQELASVTVITREQIERAQAFDLAELLRFTAGVELGRSGGPGQQTSVFIRGAASAHTLVLVDGQRINRLTAGGASFENIPADMIDHVEIVKGPRATLYGSDAIGGVINIITRRASGTGGDLAAGGGTHHTADGSIFGSTGSDDSGVSVRMQHQETGGIPAVAGLTDPSSFRQNSANLQGTTNAGPVRLSARGWYSQGRAQYFNQTFDLTGAFTGYVPASHDLHNLTVAGDAGMKFSDSWTSTLTVAHTEDRIDERQSTDYLHNERPSLSWNNTLGLDRFGRVAFGAEGAAERVDAISFGTPVHESREVYTAFVQDEVDVAAHHVLLAAGAQHNQAYGDHSTWNAGYGYDLLPGTRVLANAGSAFHAPTAFDRFTGFGGNPKLRPETARSYEVGATQQFGASQSVDLRLFRSDIRDLIEFPPPTFAAINVGRARTDGVELAYRLRAFHGFSADVTGTVQNPKDRDTGRQLLRRSRATLGARLSQDIVNGYVALDTLAQAHRTDADIVTGGPTRDSGYALLNLAAGWRMGSHWSLDARAENLLDRKYQTASGYNQPGASFFAGTRYRF